MAKINDLNATVDKWQLFLKRKIAKNQQKIAQELCKDIQQRAPIDTGRYRNSIQVSNTKVEGDTISTRVYSDLKVGGSDPKWADVPLGHLLEWGTGIKGASTGEAYEYGYEYRLTPWCYYSEKLGQWVTTTGMVARPHFSTGLNAIKPSYKRRLLGK